MTQDEYEVTYDILQADARAYVEKWGTWKSAYYAGVLSVSGIIIAIVPALASGKGDIVLLASKVSSLLAIISAACVMWNMNITIQLYDSLGMKDIPKNPEGLPAYHQYYISKMKEFTQKGRHRRFMDRLVIWCLVGCACCFTIALYLQN